MFIILLVYETYILCLKKSAHLNEILNMFSFTSHTTGGGGNGRSPLPFFENREKSFCFWVKDALFKTIYGLSSHLKCCFKSILEKKTQNFSLQDPFLYFVHGTFIEVPLFQETSTAPNDFWLRACLFELLYQYHLVLCNHQFHEETTPDIDLFLNYTIELYLGVIHCHKEHVFYNSSWCDDIHNHFYHLSAHHHSGHFHLEIDQCY